MITRILHQSILPKSVLRGLAVMGLCIALLLTACGGGTSGTGGEEVVALGEVGTPVPFEPTATADPGPAPLDMNAFEVGGQTHGLDEINIPLMQQAGMTWVKFQHKWTPGASGADVAGRIIDAHSAGFKVLLSVPGPGEFPSTIDYQAYINFLTEAATYQPDAIEVWNEMNIDREWPTGQISAVTYVEEMLAPAYDNIKGVNPNIMVISGAMSPTGAFGGCTANGCDDNVYTQEMAAAGADQHMDCVGVHFNAGATPPSATTGHPADQGDGHYSWYYSGTYGLYSDTFSKPLCFTELGYVSPEGYGEIADTFSWGKDTTVAQQAQWLGENIAQAKSAGDVRLVIVFNIDFDYYGPDDPQAGYAILRSDGSCPACDAIAAAIR